MFTLGFAGCVGALRENICLLKFFCGAIVFIFLLELAVAVLAFLFQDWVRDRVKEFFENNIKSYRDDIDLQNLIDSLQKINHCCGAQGPDDWDLNIYFNCSSESKSREKCGVPFSCCIPDPAQKVVNTQCGYDVRKKSKSQWDDQIFIKGCILALEAWLPRNIYIVAGVFIAISLLQGDQLVIYSTRSELQLSIANRNGFQYFHIPVSGYSEDYRSMDYFWDFPSQDIDF
ncbi:tetraspanin-14 isoform X4 [Apteryx rowi]|nr:tetraspanin-14 isoform X4 [Apteryx rowi]